MVSKNISKKSKKIAPPPISASYKELDKYFSQHSLEDLERAGLAEKLSPKEQEWLAKLTTAIKTKVDARNKSRSQLNLAFPEPELSRFIRYAEQKHLPASTLARAWILERLDKELRQNK